MLYSYRIQLVVHSPPSEHWSVNSVDCLTVTRSSIKRALCHAKFNSHPESTLHQFMTNDNVHNLPTLHLGNLSRRLHTEWNRLHIVIVGWQIALHGHGIKSENFQFHEHWCVRLFISHRFFPAFSRLLMTWWWRGNFFSSSFSHPNLAVVMSCLWVVN